MIFKKAKTVKIMLVFICIVLIIGSVVTYFFLKSEKMFYKYSSDGDVWVSEDKTFTITYHAESNETSVPNYYFTASIKDFENEVEAGQCYGGHSKTLEFFIPHVENGCLFFGEYTMINKNEFELKIYDDEDFDASISEFVNVGSTYVFHKAN